MDFSFLLSFFFFAWAAQKHIFCWDYNGKQKGKAQSCFYEVSTHLLWLARDLEEKAASCFARSQKKREEAIKKPVRLIESHYHVCCVL